MCIVLSSIHEQASIEHQPCFVGKERKFKGPQLTVPRVTRAIQKYAALVNYDGRIAWSFMPYVTRTHWLNGIWLNLDYAKSLTVFGDSSSQLDALAEKLSEYAMPVEEIAFPLCVPSVYETMVEKCIHAMHMKPCD